MGDMTAEPSMEDILSSIKRIIAEEGEPAPIRARRSPPRPAPLVDDDDAAEVLELSDPMPAAARQPAPPPVSRVAEEAPMPAREPAPSSPGAADPIVSQRTAAATRGSLEALSRLMVKPEPPGDGTLEGLVREMLRPMLSEWLDANLPAVVEAMVEREIAKITATR